MPRSNATETIPRHLHRVVVLVRVVDPIDFVTRPEPPYPLPAICFACAPSCHNGCLFIARADIIAEHRGAYPSTAIAEFSRNRLRLNASTASALRRFAGSGSCVLIPTARVYQRLWSTARARSAETTVTRAHVHDRSSSSSRRCARITPPSRASLKWMYLSAVRSSRCRRS